MRRIFIYLGELLESISRLDKWTLKAKTLVISDYRGTHEFIYTVPVRCKWLFRVAMYLQQGPEIKDWRIMSIPKHIMESEHKLATLKFWLKKLFSCHRMVIENRRYNDPNQITYYSPYYY